MATQPPVRPQVAYLGPPASFSHQAALGFFSPPSSSSSSTTAAATGVAADLHPLDSFAAIFSALQLQSQPRSQSQSSPKSQSASHLPSESDKPTIFPSAPHITHAIVPIENSSNGTVVSLLDLLADPSGLYPDIKVCAEFYLPVHHCLLARPSAGCAASGPGPGAERGDGNEKGEEGAITKKVGEEKEKDQKISRIKKLHTHPQVWGQCTRFLAEKLREVERIDMGSTSGAAKFVAENTPAEDGGTWAAIGSCLAGEVNGLEVLADQIEDQGDNTTRFLVLYNAEVEGDPLRLLSTNPSPVVIQEQTKEEEWTKKHKSLISFTLNHFRPGSLADALAVFRTCGFNLTSIETRPSQERLWHYIFFVECEEVWAGGRGGGRENMWEENVREMVKKLGEVTERRRWLGGWVDALQGGG